MNIKGKNCDRKWLISKDNIDNWHILHLDQQLQNLSLKKKRVKT